LAESFDTSGPAAKLKPFKGGWAASVADRKLLVHYLGGKPQIELTLERPISDIAADDDGHLLAVAAADSVIVIDNDRHAVATVFRPGGNIACVQFVNKSTLAACDKGSILILNLDLLPYFSMSILTTESMTSP